MVRKTLLFLVCMLWSNPLWPADILHQTAPIYDPASKSYFQLFNDNYNPGNWDAARQRAGQKFFKGVRGRLAVVDSAEKHKFILQNFGLDWRDASIWIGLRYWCSVHLLQWEGSLPYSPSEANHFAMWHSPWMRGNQDPCQAYKSGKLGFAPVYYTNIGGTVRWQAVGAAKYFTGYLVEFVTNGE